jgi:hypothetical protein
VKNFIAERITEKNYAETLLISPSAPLMVLISAFLLCGKNALKLKCDFLNV